MLVNIAKLTNSRPNTDNNDVSCITWVCGALELSKAMFLSEWYQVTQIHVVYRAKCSLDLKIQDRQACSRGRTG